MCRTNLRPKARTNDFGGAYIMLIIENGNTITINEDYLQCVLGKKEKDSSLLVTKCNVLSDVSKGQGYLSSMTRIEAEIVKNGSNEKKHLIMKTVPTEASAQNFLMELTAFPNEIRMFSETLPQVSKLLKSVGKLAEIGAKFYYCRDKLPYLLIVEDLTAKGFQMADRRKGLDLKHCLLVMEALGRYHAATIALHDINPELVERHNETFWSEDATDRFLENNITMGLNAAATIADQLYPNGENYGERLKKKAKTLRKDVKDLFILNRNNFNVLTHGDLWLNNLMFRYDETSGEVQEVKFVDFQLGCYAPAVIDLQYFIHSSPTEEVRINHTNDMFKAYHLELSETLKLLGYQHKAISFPKLITEYEKNASFGFLCGLVIYQIFLADKDDDFDLATVAENKGRPEGFQKRASNPLFVRALKRFLPIFDEMGVF